jgi:23S rRNA (cytosine1962-C5)-methyltransferase
MASMKLTGKGRRWVLGGHPWIYRDDIAAGTAQAGDLVQVLAPTGESLGWALFSDASRIALRLVTRDEEQPTREFWMKRVQRAVDTRARAGMLEPDGACRLIAGDSEGLPGMVVDRYGKVAVLQLGTQGADRMGEFLVELIREALPFELDAVVNRSDTAVRKLENLPKQTEVMHGSVTGPIEVRDGDLIYAVDVFQGHKTGHYLDQVDNRRRAARLAEGERVLDAFAYDGLFGIRAAMAGASDVVCLEQNKAACERLVVCAERNGVADRVRVERVNCMKDLRARAEQGEEYGLVILDPPAFARSKRERAGAERGYVELARRGLALTRPGGSLVSASCSFNIRASEFRGFLASAAHLAGRDVWMEQMTGASPDHPELLTLPESSYLKCAFLRVD